MRKDVPRLVRSVEVPTALPSANDTIAMISGSSLYCMTNDELGTSACALRIGVPTLTCFLLSV